MLTGGSSGIGLALGRKLVGSGAHICLVARDTERLAAAVEELRSLALRGDQIICSVPMDVTSEEAVTAGVPRVLEALQGLDLLINNAGWAAPGYVAEQDERVYQDMLAVNYLGPVRIIRALLPHFLGRRGGHIVNVTSMLGFMGTFGYSAYAGSKFALSGYTECLRQELLPSGIRVHLCYPPSTTTPGLERENLTKPPETWAIEGASRAFAPEQVADAIMDGILRDRFHILVGYDSYLIWIAQRLAPGLVRFVTDRILRKHLRLQGSGQAASIRAAQRTEPREFPEG